MAIIKEFDYEIVKDNVNLLRKAYQTDKEILTGALSVLTIIRHYFDNKINKEVFEEWFMEWSGQFEQSDIFPNSGKNKDVMKPVYELIKNINRWSKKNLNRKQVLISRKDIFKAIPEDKLENI